MYPMTMRKSPTIAGHFIALLLLFALSPAAVALPVFNVSIDTSSISGLSGFLDIQLNPGGAQAPAAFAALSGFATDGTLLAGAMADGDINGDLSTGLTIGNGQALNALLQPIMFGTSLDFVLTFSGPWLTAGGNVGSLFSFDLLSATLDSLFGATALALDLMPGGAITVVAISAPVSVTQIPVSATLWLLASGLMLAAVRRRSSPAASIAR